MIRWRMALLAALCLTVWGCGSSDNDFVFTGNAGPAGATVTGVSVSPATASIADGTSQQFRLLASFSNGTSQDFTSAVEWESSNPAVATIDDLGRASAQSAGTTTVTASYAGYEASAQLTVTSAQLQSITITPGGPSIATGTTVQLSASGSFSDGSTQILDGDVTWASSAAGVATVSPSGLVTGVAPGSATISASLGAVSGSVPLTVSNATLTGIEVLPAAPSNVGLGQSLRLTVLASFSDDSTQDVTSAAGFASAQPAVASVSTGGASGGVVTGNSIGSTSITVTYQGQTVNRPITVAAAVVPQANAFAVDAAGTNLLRFSTTTPGTVTTSPITGLTAGDAIVGIDFRPQNGFLYGLGFNAANGDLTVYCLSLGQQNGAPTSHATPVGPPIDGAYAADTTFGFDFNPQVDRIRVVASNSESFILNPNTGAFQTGNGALNGGSTTASGSAYTNNTINTPRTTLFALDHVSDSLYLQIPGTGLLTLQGPVQLGGNTIDFSGVNGFDILPGIGAGSANTAPESGQGLAALTVAGTTSLYSIDLNTGAATSLGAIGNGATGLNGLALQYNLGGRSAVAIDPEEGLLLRFNTEFAQSWQDQGISGVGSEFIVGLDWRPATGQLMALGIDEGGGNGTLYLVDPQNAQFTPVGGANGLVGLVDATNTPIIIPDLGLGFDFNPTVDRIRVVSETGLNFRINPNTGVAVDGAPEVGTQPDGAINGAVTGVSGAAYTNSFATAAGGITTLYTMSANTKSLYIQTPPNAGTQTAALPITLNGALLNFSQVNGFDIPSSVLAAAADGPAATNSEALAVLSVNGGDSSLYRINLTTGAAVLLDLLDENTFESLAVGN